MTYWSLASRTPSAEGPTLAPPPVLFRPERGPALDEAEAEPTPTVRSAPRVEAPRLEYGIPMRPVLSDPLPPWGEGLGWGVKLPPREASSPFGDALTPHPNPPPQGGREQNQEQRPAPLNATVQEGHPQPVDANESEAAPLERAQPPLQPTPIVRIERVLETETVEREAPLTPKPVPVAMQPTSPAPRPDVIATNVIETEPRREPEAKPRPVLQPPTLVMPPMATESPPRSPQMALLPPPIVREVPDREEPAERTEVRIGSIVVHLDPPTPRPVPQVAAPVAPKPSGPLARGFTGFGFHQS